MEAKIEKQMIWLVCWKCKLANDKYCRTWKEWRSGKKVNCWEMHKGSAKHFDTEGYYFLCENGVPDGDVHVVLEGNAFEINYSGNGKKSGKLTQNDKVAEKLYIPRSLQNPNVLM
jgi:hypothetical protein